ncbi:phosphoglycolate phosphatase-like HAD superfamily hydrolase [Pararhizobium capsulatum DSM 1112]|uniref:phosphoglycolate phosphatase n=1 Tax=Pararhizobium capsulatum DSM 1112 TaxID=1121113 RepID=A0ABU0BZZ9_9HYPH|nr:HAD hydrolase-like protein [Pararhizobium capsulatum]MDQ0323274.1 phosphoglycolate phosphatase-like HAD superfamily hydrolase [Pararhizobium capsulatum DSM 1112]
MTLASPNPKQKMHVLFDLDGTLVDTRGAVVECYTRVFRSKLDSNFPPEEFPIADLFAMRPAEVFAVVAPDRIDELHAAYRDTYPQCTALIKVFAGIRELILDLASAGRKPSVVTNKGLERTLIDLQVANIAPEVFAAIVTAEDTVDRKPHPAPILLGLERAGANVGDAVYVGDGPQDILAARAAGMDCVAVSYGFYDGSLLATHTPTVLVDNVAGLAAALGVAHMSRASQ